MLEMRETGMVSKAWPFDEARRILKRYEKAPPDKGYVLFETGYGPSGLPHIGTFAVSYTHLTLPTILLV